MGRKWHKKKGPKDGNKVERTRKPRATDGNYVVAVRENKDFETYYKSQKIVPENEWDDFYSTLKENLPVAFRLTGNTTKALALLRILKEDYFAPLKDVSAFNAELAKRNALLPEGAEAEEPVKPLEPKCLEWYPENLGYQLNLSRRDIRRCEPYWRLHQCLISETEAGSISRQETVSMIPPLLMDILPHHKVLDMCAAPGSKTAQLIEQLHGGSEGVEAAIPSGVVVANDSDNKRCYLLTHQAKRLQSPCIMITNHDAAFMPNFFYTKPDGSSGKLKFDRILCDVPCSGDGTMRKNADIWTKWNPINACNLHGLQLRIARRGLEMLAVGGRMVYSTCSLSPLENEAVVQRLLLEAEGSVSLVDVGGKLKGLKYRPGLTKWVVMSKEMKVIPTAEDIPKEWTNLYHRHLFPTDKDLKLERCLRPLPHHQDTGGFFVAVLEKTALLPGEVREVEKILPFTTDAAGKKTYEKPLQRFKSGSKKRPRGFKEEPYFYLSDKIAEWESKSKAEQEAMMAEWESKSKTEKEIMETSPAEEKLPEPLKSSDVTVQKDDEKKLAEQISAESEQKDEEADDEEDVKLWALLSKFFGLRKDVPEASFTNFMSRSKEKNSRNIYFTNSLIRDLVERNQEKMKIINTGTKAFVRSENKGTHCGWRMSQEGIQAMLPLISHRSLAVTREDLVQILIDNDAKEPPQLLTMSPLVQGGARALESGSVVMEYHGDPSRPQGEQGEVPAQDKIKIELVGWKGASSLRCYVTKQDRVHFLRLLRADLSTYVTNKFEVARDKLKNEANEEGASAEEAMEVEASANGAKHLETGNGAAEDDTSPPKKLKMDL